MRRPWSAAIAAFLFVGGLGAATAAPAAATTLPLTTSVSPTSGPLRGGTLVTVHGLYFGHVTKVLFGGTPGTSFKRISSTSVQARTPARKSSGTVPVVATTLSGAHEGGPTPTFRYVSPPRIMRIAPTTGSGVRIDGLNFYAAVHVWFGRLEATNVRVVSPGTVTATAPRNTSGAVSVALSSRYGRSSAVTATAHRYVALPTITKVDRPVSPPQGGESIQLTGANYVYVTKVTFGGVAAPSVYVGGGHAYPVTPPHAAGTVDLRITTRYGTSLAAKFTYTRPKPSFSWSPTPPRDPWQGATTALTCAGSAFCLATDRTSAALFNGETWSEPERIDPAGGVVAASCPTSDYCLAVDSGGRAMTFDGAGWSAPKPVSASGFEAVSCPAANECVAVTEQAVLRMHEGVWGEPIPIPGWVASVSCPTTTFCAVTAGRDVYTFDGATWRPVQVTPTATLRSVSCPTETFCAAVDEYGNAVTYDGTSWSAPVKLFADGNARSVSCTATGRCVATSLFRQWSAFDGTNWTPEESFDPIKFGLSQYPSFQSGLACDPGGTCRYGDLLGRVLTLTDSGWSPPLPVFTPTGLPTSASCWAAGRCAVSDAAGSVSRLGDAGWSTTSVDPVNRAGSEISCPSEDFCALVDGAGSASIYRAGSWDEPQAIEPADFGPSAIDCVSATFCVTINSSGWAYTFDGQGWSAPVSTGLEDVVGVSCPTTTFCVAVGQNRVARFDGTTWREPQTVNTPPTAGGFQSLTAVDCASASFCVAGSVGGSVRYVNGGWQPFDWFTEGSPVDSISCPSDTFCLAVLSDNSLVTFDGHTWSEPLTSTPPYYRTSVSCVDPENCLVIGGLTGSVGGLAPASS